VDAFRLPGIKEVKRLLQLNEENEDAAGYIYIVIVKTATFRRQ